MCLKGAIHTSVYALNNIVVGLHDNSEHFSPVTNEIESKYLGSLNFLEKHQVDDLS